MIHIGDCLSVLPTLAEKSMHTCVTSPPYFGLRDYGVDGQIGLEPTPDAFVAAMVRVFREVKRVLRDDGCLWLNLGDSFNSSSQHNHGKGGKMEHNHLAPKEGWAGHRPMAPGLKPKDLIGIPWRVAFALQADGWYLRSDIIWHKPNPMPESVRDRPTKSHEYMFLLSKSPRYYWDAEAVREPHAPPSGGRQRAALDGSFRYSGREHKTQADVGAGCRNGGVYDSPINPAGRNIRSVWTIPTRSFKGAHFATFPPRLVEPCIKAGTSERGCCPGCGKPWVRVVERKGETVAERMARASRDYAPMTMRPDGGSLQHMGGAMTPPGGKPSVTTGWRPDCSCGTERPIPVADLEADPTLIDDFEIEPFPPIPCTVLDPFAGAGTVGLVAKQLGRSFVGIELNPEYAAMAGARIAQSQPQQESTPRIRKST